MVSNLPLIATRVGLVQGLVCSQHRLDKISTGRSAELTQLRGEYERKIQYNVRSGYRLLYEIGTGHNPRVLERLSELSKELGAVNVDQQRARARVARDFVETNRLMGALLFARPLAEALPILPTDLGALIPARYQESDHDLYDFFDAYFEYVTQWGSLQAGSLALFIHGKESLPRASSIDAVRERREKAMIEKALELLDGDVAKAAGHLGVPRKVITDKMRRFGISIPQSETETASDDTLAEVEKRTVEQALRAEGWNQTRAAKRLGLSRSSLLHKMKKHGLLRPASETEAAAPLKEAVRKASEKLERELIESALAQTQGDTAQAAKLLKLSKRSLLKKLQSFGLAP